MTNRFKFGDVIYHTDSRNSTMYKSVVILSSHPDNLKTVYVSTEGYAGRSSVLVTKLFSCPERCYLNAIKDIESSTQKQMDRLAKNRDEFSNQLVKDTSQ